MNTRILNRDFEHPSDHWYHIEAKGEHPNNEAGLIQIIDDTAIDSIVNRFNADARAGQLHHGSEMLIDHEHFADQPDKETRAYGWLQELQNRADGVYGRIRWTTTGKAAVDGGDYRFFSTEYLPKDLKVLNDGKPRRVRPLRLDGLSLTNKNNNRGQKPITNREGDSGYCPHCGSKLSKQSDGKAKCADCGKVYNKNFADACASADITETNQPKGKMKTVCTLLGLSADASEEALHAAVSKIINRGDITPEDLTKLRNRSTELETTNKTLLDEQVEALLDAHGVKEEKVRNRLSGVLTGMKNRKERVEALVDFGFEPVDPKAENEEKPAQRGGKVLNRAQAKTPASKTGESEEENARKAEAEIADYKVRNRCSYSDARNAVRAAKPELFGLKQ